MKAKIKSLENATNPIESLKDYLPNNIYNFKCNITLLIGPEDGPGEELFNIEVVSPLWLQDNMREDDIYQIKAMIIMKEYKYDSLVNFLRKKIESITGKDWGEIGEKISQFSYWEFENYRN